MRHYVFARRAHTSVATGGNDDGRFRFRSRNIRNEFRAIDPGIPSACAAVTAARRLFTTRKVECDCAPKV